LIYYKISANISLRQEKNPIPKRIQFLILTQSYRNPWPLDNGHRDPPDIFQSQDRVVQD